jgi:hypothetical protein
VKQILDLEYIVDLTKLEGGGDFLCPYCRALISPEDETEELYSVLEAKVRNDVLENILIRCNICSNEILLTGFSVLGN